VIGCRRRSSAEDQEPAKQAAQPTNLSSASPELAAEAQDQAKAAERLKAAEALLARWEKAQNSGDFAAYEQLYAERFTGTKRVGTRTRRFDRASWLEDRRSMFDRPFVVQIADVRVSGTHQVLSVEFTQTWSSATFRDVGTKELRLILEKGEYRVTSEEMKTSSAGAPKETSDPPKPEEFSFVLELPNDATQGPELRLLLSVPLDVNSVSGPPRYADKSRAHRDVVTKALAPELQRMVGQKYVVYGIEGTVCEATVAGFEALIHLEPHFGMVNHWEASHRHGPEVPVAQRALDLWNLSERTGRFLTALLEPTSVCTSPRWARAAKLPAPKLWTWRESTAEERGAVLAAARATSHYRQVAGNLREPWDEESKRRFAFFEDGSGQVFASLTLGASGEECSQPYDMSLFALFRMQGEHWKLVSAGPDDHAEAAWPRFLEPVRADMAFDLDGDGRPEFVGGKDLIDEVGGTYRSILNLSPAYFDCPC
jgi:hypothetical protein